MKNRTQVGSFFILFFISSKKIILTINYIMRKVLPSVFLIVGTIVGAGFASGREISSFFAKFGVYSLFFLPILFIIFYYVFKMLLSIGKDKKFESIKQLNSFTKNSIFMNILISATFIIFTSAMFSGVIEILSYNFTSIPSVVFYIILPIICFVVLKFGFSGLVKLNFILVPILILSILTLCVFATFNPVTDIVFIPASSKAYELPISIILYAMGNLLLSYYIIIKAGKGLDEKRIKTISFLSSFIICFVIFISIVCLIKNGSAVIDASMPFVALSYRMGELFNVFFLIMVLLAILTTLFSGLYTSCMSLPLKKHNIAFTIICVEILSLLGFKQIVDYIYPIIGVIGISVILRLAFAYKSSLKSSFNSCNNKVHSPSKQTKN